MPLSTVRWGSHGRPASPWWRGSGNSGSTWAYWASDSSWRCMGSLLRDTPQLRSWVYFSFTPLLLCSTEPSYMGNEKEWVDEQVRWHQAAIAAAPANYAAHINLGVALDEKGQVDEAIACYNKAIALNPKNGIAYL